MTHVRFACGAIGYIGCPVRGLVRPFDSFRGFI